MNNPDLTTYLVTGDPSMLHPHEEGMQDPRSSEELDPGRARRKLDVVHRCWRGVVAGRPVQGVIPPHLVKALGNMQAAATWVARNPEHPALMALMAQLRRPPIYLLLGRSVLWEDQESAELYLPGMTSSLYIQESGGTLPISECAYDDDLNVSGLLGVAHSDDTRYGMHWLQVAMWPLPHAEVDRMIAEIL